MSLSFRESASALTWRRAGQVDGHRSGGARRRLPVAPACALFVFLAIIAVDAAARPNNQPSCREQPVVQQLLKQAGGITQAYETRRKAYERAARVCSQDASIDSALTALLLEHQDAEAALVWARRGLVIAPTDTGLKVFEGIALLLVGHPDQALTILKAAPSNGKNQFYLGMTYRALRQHQDAQQAFLKAFELGFNDPYVLYARIEQDHALGDKEAGLSDFKTLYQHFPDSPWLHMLYGDAYMAKNDSANAQAEYQQVAKLAPNLPIVQYQLGYLDFIAARYADAAEHFRKEIAVNPAFASAYLYLGTTLRRLNRNLEALLYLVQAVAHDPNYDLAYSELATAQEQAGQTEEALRTLKAAERHFPQEAAFPAQAAGLLRRLNRPQEAKIEGEKATELSQKNNPIKHGDAEHGVPASGTTVQGPAASRNSVAPDGEKDGAIERVQIRQLRAPVEFKVFHHEPENQLLRHTL